MVLKPWMFLFAGMLWTNRFFLALPQSNLQIELTGKVDQMVMIAVILLDTQILAFRFGSFLIPINFSASR